MQPFYVSWITYNIVTMWSGSDSITSVHLTSRPAASDFPAFLRDWWLAISPARTRKKTRDGNSSHSTSRFGISRNHVDHHDHFQHGLGWTNGTSLRSPDHVIRGYWWRLCAGVGEVGNRQTSRKYPATFIVTVAALGSTATFLVEIPTDDR